VYLHTKGGSIMRRVLSTATIIAVLIIMAGCGGGTQTTPAPSVPDSPPPAADAPSSAADLPELTESTTSNNGVTVRYPAGWEEPISTVGVFLYNNSGAQTALALLRFREGQLAFQINAQPVSTQRNFEEAFNFHFGSLASGVNITLSTPEAITVGEAPALRATGSSDAMGMYLALIQVSEGWYITFVAYTNPAELEAQTPLIEAVMNTVSHSAP
jgi:hypothetical protein